MDRQPSPLSLEGFDSATTARQRHTLPGERLLSLRNTPAQHPTDHAPIELTDQDRYDLIEDAPPSNFDEFINTFNPNSENAEVAWKELHLRLLKHHALVNEAIAAKNNADTTLHELQHAQEQDAQTRNMLAQNERQAVEEADRQKQEAERLRTLNQQLSASVQTANAARDAANAEAQKLAAAARAAGKKPGASPAWPAANPFQTGATTKLSKSLPDPPMFNGDRAKLEGWLTQLYIKLTMNDDHYPTDRAKLMYAYSRLEGSAEQLLRPYISIVDGGLVIQDLTTLRNFSDVLEHAYGDPDKAKTAYRKLKDLRQGTGTFSSYKSTFMSLMAILKYTGESRVNALKDGLSWELQHALSNMWDEPKDFVELCKRLDILDNNQRNFVDDAKKNAPKSLVQHYVPQPVPRNNNNSNNAASSTQAPAAAAPLPRNDQGQFVPQQAAQQQRQYSVGEPMDLSAVSRTPLPLGPDGRVTQAEKDRRRALKLCEFCGKHPARVTCRGLYKRDPAAAMEKAKAAGGTGAAPTMLFQADTTYVASTYAASSIPTNQRVTEVSDTQPVMSGALPNQQHQGKA